MNNKQVTMASFSSNPVSGLLFSARSEKQQRSSATVLEQEVLALFDLLRVRLLSYAVSFGLSVHDSEDVIQEVFLALFRHLQQGRSRENLTGWTFRVTHNLALNRRMANQSEGGLPQADPSEAERCRDFAPSPEEQILFRERQTRLRAVLSALPETDRCCLQLRAEGLKYREIAKVLEISLGSVAASVARSLARLERTDRREA